MPIPLRMSLYIKNTKVKELLILMIAIIIPESG